MRRVGGSAAALSGGGDGTQYSEFEAQPAQNLYTASIAMPSLLPRSKLKDKQVTNSLLIDVIEST